MKNSKGLAFKIISDDWCTLDWYCMPDDESVIFPIQTLVFYYHVLLWKVALESFDWSFQKVKKEEDITLSVKELNPVTSST